MPESEECRRAFQASIELIKEKCGISFEDTSNSMDIKEIEKLWNDGEINELVANCIIQEDKTVCRFLKEKMKSGELKRGTLGYKKIKK